MTWMRGWFVVCAVLVVVWVSAAGVWAVGFDEVVDGELSDDPFAPTALGTLGIGANRLSLSVVRDDYDLVTFAVAPGTRVESIVLEDYAGSTVSFAGLQSGDVWTTGLGVFVDPAPLLGWVLFGDGQVGTDILDDFGQGAGSIGFTPPLGPGTYTLELQETGPLLVSTSLTLNVVPEPAAIVTGLIGAAGLARCRRRGRS